MTGWAIEQTDPSSGSVDVETFELGKAWRAASGEIHLAYFGDEHVPAWLAVADRESKDVWVAPDGTRYRR